MDMDFAVSRPLVRPGLPHIRFLFVRSRLCSTLPSDPASRRRPCASLTLHLHQVVQGTCTPRLSNMLGTRLNRSAVGKTQVSFTSRWPQQLASSPLPSFCLGRVWPLFFHFAVVEHSTQNTPFTHLFNLLLKAKAVPVAASSSAFVSAGPTGPELRPRSSTALRIQDSSNDASTDLYPPHSYPRISRPWRGGNGRRSVRPPIRVIPVLPSELFGTHRASTQLSSSGSLRRAGGDDRARPRPCRMTTDNQCRVEEWRGG